jgi:hypothetical protein
MRDASLLHDCRRPAVAIFASRILEPTAQIGRGLFAGTDHEARARRSRAGARWFQFSQTAIIDRSLSGEPLRVLNAPHHESRFVSNLYRTDRLTHLHL